MKLNILAGMTICLLMLMAPPGAASDQTLGVFGNANEDGTINMQDVTYTELIILEYQDATELADAKYDGEIDILDVTQIELIILEKEKELTILDTANRIVTIDKPLESIIVLNRNIVEMMRSIDLDKEKIVSVSSDVLSKKTYFPEFTDCPNVGKASSPDIENILNMRPDAVFIYATVMSPDWVVNQLEEAGITVISFDCFKIESYVEEAVKLGYIFNKRNEAEEFVDFYNNCMINIEEKVSELNEDEKPTVYFERFRDPFSTVGKDTASHHFIELSGGINIFNDQVGYIKNIDPEEVIIRNPEFIIKQASPPKEYGYNINNDIELKNIRDEIIGRSGFEKISAVIDENVYVINRELTGGKHFIAIGYYVKWLHPKLFEDLDPQAVHQRYLTEFQQMDFNLDVHGVFVYPPFDGSV